MKALVFGLLVAMLLPGVSYAQHIGPGVPAKNLSGNIASPNFGIGYGFRQAEYEGVDIEDQRVYAHIGVVFGDESTPSYEVYLRLGGSAIKTDGDFNSSIEPLYAAGIKGEFYQGRIFGWGGVLQGLYVDSYDDIIQVDGQIIDISLEKNWEVELAFPIHARINHGLLYLGPVFYNASADVVSRDISQETGSIDEDRNVGVFGGAAWRSRNVSFEIEAKFKSDLSFGALLTFVF